MKKININTKGNIFVYQDDKQRFYITAFSLLNNKIVLYKQRGKLNIFLNKGDQIYKNKKLIFNF